MRGGGQILKIIVGSIATAPKERAKMMLRMGANLAAQMLDEPAISSRAGGASGCEVGGLSQWGSGNIVCPNIPKLGGRSDHPPPGRTMFAATRFEKPPTSPPPALDSTRPRGRTARPRRSAARPRSRQTQPSPAQPPRRPAQLRPARPRPAQPPRRHAQPRSSAREQWVQAVARSAVFHNGAPETLHVRKSKS